ncbi:DNA polymerase [Clostridium phage DCp1]|uniref:DNA-directed DNA polymerase n=1 Tax=Clostridium phage DCp1 TaxID=2981543 RepID=A0A977R7V6_9CAUD|nr:DNA polymerase [Clostridium phage DCp1]
MLNYSYYQENVNSQFNYIISKIKEKRLEEVKEEISENQQILNNIKANIDKYILFDEKLPYPETLIKTKKSYSADLETTTKVNENGEIYTFAYACGFMEVNKKNKLIHSNNISDFVDNLENLPALNSEMYFHNLTFDLTFILIELIKRGYEPIIPHFLDIEEIKSCKVTGDGTVDKELFITKEMDYKNKDIKPYSFDYIFANGSFYECTIYFDERRILKNGKYETVTKKLVLKDSLKLVPSTLQQLADGYCGLKLSKDGINHDKQRQEGKEHILHHSEKIYYYEDIYALKEFIRIMIKEGVNISGENIKFDRMTSASFAFNQYKESLKKEYDNFVKLGEYPSCDEFVEIFSELSLKYADRKNGPSKEKIFRAIFPVLSAQQDGFIRESYFGGIAMKNKRLLAELEEINYKENINKQNSNLGMYGVTYDENSMYPDKMNRSLLPYGRPKNFNGNYEDLEDSIKSKYPLYIQKIRVKYFNLKPDGIPMQQLRNSVDFNGREFIESNYCEKYDNYVTYTLVLTNVHLKDFFRNYEVDGIEYLGGLCFKGTHGLFKSFIEKWYKIKQENKGVVKLVSKLILNSCYGKFASNPVRSFRFINLNDDILDVSKYDYEGEEINYFESSIYTAVGSFITSYAREDLLQMLHNNFDRWLYADTDSCHLLGFNDAKGDKLDINNTGELGLWKRECYFSDSIFLGAKRYAENEIKSKENLKLNSKWEVKCCGLPKNIMSKIDIKSFGFIDPSINEDELFISDDKEDYHYYKDENCTEKVVGIWQSRKKKSVKGGIIIKSQPYKLNSAFSLR